MSEQLTVLFEQLRGSQPPAPFAPPEEVRRRGRQRTHRQALAAGSAVLAVAGLGAGWALGTAGGSPTPPLTSPLTPPSPSVSTFASPSSSPTLGSSTVPVSALLTPEDFAAIDGVQANELDDKGVDGPGWPWKTILGGCPGFRSADFPTVSKRRDGRGLGYGNGTWSGWEVVERYFDAAANLADVRSAIAACPTTQLPDGPRTELSIVAEGFAGDDSVLVRQDRSDRNDYVVVVRAGDLVATLWYSDGPEADARDMAEAMVARLR